MVKQNKRAPSNNALQRTRQVPRAVERAR